MAAAIMERSSELVVVVDEHGHTMFVSPSVEALLGYHPANLLGVDAFAFVHPAESGALRVLFDAALAEPGLGVPFEIRLRAADGRYVEYELLASNLIHDPAVRGMVFQGRDISKRKSVERALRIAEEQFEAIFVHAPLCISLIDLEGKIIDVNYAAGALLGRTRRAMIGTDAIECVHPDDRDRVLQATTRQLAGSNTPVEFRVVRADGQPVWVLSKAALVDPGGDDQPYVVTIQTDISERRALEEQLAREATSDPLTGLLNRGAFMTQLELTLARRSPHPPALLFIDLDHFKDVNDSLGHDAGDIVLGTLATRIERLVREGDLVCRLGGDEFVVFCQDLPPSEASRIAERIRVECARPIDVRGQHVTVGASVGVASGDSGEGPAMLLRRADAAVYAAKRAGRGQVAVADPAAAAA